MKSAKAQAATTYLSSGKLFFVTNADHTRFLDVGTHNTEHDGDLVVSSLEHASFFKSLTSAKAKLPTAEIRADKTYYGTDKESRLLRSFLLKAEVGVLVYKTRKLRITK